MINTKYIANMTVDEMNEDNELKQKLLNEIVKMNIKSSYPKSIYEMTTAELFDLYNFLVDIINKESK